MLYICYIAGSCPRPKVEQLFRKIDTRGLGHVTITEFENHFDDQAL